MSKQVKYRIYPSLIDSYESYLSSEDTWLRYWGNSDTPAKTIEQFEQEQFQNLIDKINRIPMRWEDSEKADRGTAFGEIVDCVVANRKSDVMEMVSDKETGFIRATHNKRTFEFPIDICREFADYFKGAQSQVRVSAVLPTQYGNVEVYGVIDELMPTCIHDIKTTGSYEAWKFKESAQRLIYPYCLNENGCDVRNFEFNILLITERKAGNFYDSFTEYYNYNHCSDSELLKSKVEKFIEFLEDNRNLITDKKYLTINN